MAKETSFFQLSETELYRLMSTESWKKHDPETRLELYQEAENRQAAMLGRQPLTIEVFEPEGEKKTWSGYYNNACPDKLFINARFVDGRSTLLRDMTGASGLKTIIHEGRHAYQHAVVEGRITGEDEFRRKMWMLNFSDYRNGNGDEQCFAIYTQQEVERDARKYAEDEIVRIAAIIRDESGNVDMSFEDAIYEIRKFEYTVNNSADDKEVMELLDRRDAEARERCKLHYPGEDMSGVSIFKAYRDEHKKRMAILKGEGRDDGDKVGSVAELLKKVGEKADCAAGKEKIETAQFSEVHKRQGI